MSRTSWPTLAALLLLPLAVAAQTKVQASDPGDARAPAPALGYQSSFETYLPSAKPEESPDKLWIAANREVQESSDQQEPSMGAADATREPETKAADSPPAHQHHSKGH